MDDGTLKIVRDRKETKIKGDKSRVRIPNADSQQLLHRDEGNYYKSQCKEIEENNDKRKTKDFLSEN